MQYLKVVDDFIPIKSLSRIIYGYIRADEFMEDSKKPICCQLYFACYRGYWQIVQDLLNTGITKTCGYHDELIPLDDIIPDKSIKEENKVVDKSLENLYVMCSYVAATSRSPGIVNYFKPMIGSKAIMAGLYSACIARDHKSVNELIYEDCPGLLPNFLSKIEKVTVLLSTIPLGTLKDYIRDRYYFLGNTHFDMLIEIGQCKAGKNNSNYSTYSGHHYDKLYCNIMNWDGSI